VYNDSVSKVLKFSSSMKFLLNVLLNVLQQDNLYQYGLIIDLYEIRRNNATFKRKVLNDIRDVCIHV